MISPHEYILTGFGWKCVEETDVLEYISNPDGQMRQIIGKTALRVNCLYVVLHNEDGLSRTKILVSSDQKFLLSDKELCKAIDLRPGDLMYQGTLAKESWFVKELIPVGTQEVYQLQTDKHFYIVNGCYVILGDDTL